MKFMRSVLGLAVALSWATGLAHAMEFKAIGTAPAVLYDAPSLKGKKVFVAPRGMPVEVVLTYGEWTKIRDMAGDLSWVQSNLLTPKRMVVVKVANAKIRATADDAGSPVFTSDRGVLLEPVEPPASGWLKVKHRDGQTGFVKTAEVWGA